MNLTNMGINLLPASGKAVSHGGYGKHSSSVGIGHTLFQDRIVMVNKDSRIGNLSRNLLMLLVGMTESLPPEDYEKSPCP